MNDIDKIFKLYDKGVLVPSPIADYGGPETWHFIDLDTGEIFSLSDEDEEKYGRFYPRVTKFMGKWHLVSS